MKAHSPALQSLILSLIATLPPRRWDFARDAACTALSGDTALISDGARCSACWRGWPKRWAVEQTLDRLIDRGEVVEKHTKTGYYRLTVDPECLRKVREQTRWAPVRPLPPSSSPWDLTF